MIFHFVEIGTLKMLQLSLIVSIEWGCNSWHGEGHLKSALEVTFCPFKSQFSGLKLLSKIRPTPQLVAEDPKVEGRIMG